MGKGMVEKGKPGNEEGQLTLKGVRKTVWKPTAAEHPKKYT